MTLSDSNLNFAKMHLFASLSVLVFFVAFTTSTTKGEEEEIPFVIQDPRLFATATVTTTTSLTITSTIPCTSGILAGLDQAAFNLLTKCPITLGRRRRGFLLEEDGEEQFSISPSATQG